jgi:predicted RecB family nuclease
MADDDVDALEDINTPPQYLSKSKLMSLHQCPLRLWNEVYRRDQMQEPSAQAQLLFDSGTMVGEMARGLCPGGQLIEAAYWDHEGALRDTARVIAETSIPALFEAAFEYRRTRVRSDLLVRVKNGWQLWEVKSVRNPQDKHILDVAIQAYVIRKVLESGNQPNELLDIGVVHLNADYVYDGNQYDVSSLFKKYRCASSAYELEDTVDEMISDGLEIIDSPTPPEAIPGAQCSNPYECPFLGTVCQAPEPHELSVIPGVGPARIEKLKSQGIDSLADFDAKKQSRSGPQKRMIKSWQTGKCILEPGLAERLARIGYPRFYLDFETFSPILPRYAGTSPIQALPFQFSVHVEWSDKHQPEHVGYLHDTDTDPRRPLAEALLAVLERHPTGTILMYTPYEKRILKELAAALPEYRDRIDAVTSRLVDLCAIVKDNVYHPHFHGSFSIKDVLPALVPDRGYKDLEIADGNTASLQYLQMIELAKTDLGAARAVWNQLWMYCKRDTEAMVAVMMALHRLTRDLS